MEMVSGHVFLFFFTFFFHASSLYIGDYRRPKLRTLGENKNGQLSLHGPKSQKTDLSGEGEAGRPPKMKRMPLMSTTYIKCVFNIGSDNGPDYDCQYSPDVKVNWTNTEGRLVGTLSTSFACANRRRRSVRNKMQSPLNELESKTWGKVIRDKRKTTYRIDAEEARQTEKEESGSSGNDTEEEDIIGDPEVVPYFVEDIPDEDDNGRPLDVADELTPSLRSDAGKEDDTVEPAEENEVQEEMTDDTDTTDPEVPVEEDGVAEQEKVEEGEGNVEDETETNEEVQREEGNVENETENVEGAQDEEANVENEAENVEEAQEDEGDVENEAENVEESQEDEGNVENETDNVEEAQEDEEDVDNEAENVEGVEEEGENVEEAKEGEGNVDNETENVEEAQQEKESIENEIENDEETHEENPEKEDNDDKTDDKDVTDKHCDKPDDPKCDINVDNDSILVPIQQEIDEIVSESEMPLFMDFILQLLDEAGDYLISLLVQNLRQRLLQDRIAEKFDRKVQMLSQIHGNDTAKAMEIMEKKIHEQLGKSYQLKIVEFLKQLHDTWKK